MQSRVLNKSFNICFFSSQLMNIIPQKENKQNSSVTLKCECLGYCVLFQWPFPTIPLPFMHYVIEILLNQLVCPFVSMSPTMDGSPSLTVNFCLSRHHLPCALVFRFCMSSLCLLLIRNSYFLAPLLL